MVRFAPCARTDWHSHAVGQTLHIVSGTALVQARGGEIVEVHPGETVYTPAGEEHWHGAAPDRFMSHLALWEGPGDGGTETTWGDKVTDEEYGGPRAKTSLRPDTSQIRRITETTLPRMTARSPSMTLYAGLRGSRYT